MGKGRGGKAKKDVGHGGLDEWFSGHGQGKSKAKGDATWGDWVSISPIKKTLKKEDGSTKQINPGDIVGPCGISKKPEWKEFTNSGKDPLKCMPRSKAHDMPKSERAEIAKGKMRAEKKDTNQGKEPTRTPTFKKKKGNKSTPWLSITPDIMYHGSDEDEGEHEAADTPVSYWQMDPLRPGGEIEIDNVVDAYLTRKAVWLNDAKPQPSIGRVAMRHLDAAAHERSIALMKFLARVATSLGVGRHVFVVGGAIRNFVIDRPIKDIDVVIDSVAAGMDSDQFAQGVAKAIPAATNLTTNQYGVAILTVKGNWNLDGENLKGEVIEIANARKESYGGTGGKGYKPHMVEPATIEEDVYRREFTFNTLLWRLMDLTNGPEKAEILDLTGCGLRDLEQRTLKCPRDPDVVFSDDPTRMLRAIKFTGKYNFKIPKDLADSIRRNAHKMKQMPWEAIGTLMVENVLKESTARRSLKQMQDLGLLKVVSEMIQEKKPFATYMANQLRRERRVQLLLDLMDLGVPANVPLHFLDPKGRQRVREITVAMPENEAADWVNHLIKPPVNNKQIIDALSLPGPERRHIVPKARALILADPSLAHNGRELTNLVIAQW